ncbi:FHA domain-containing protein, partial [Paraliomyxa miuraensis]|uniref:FHA domain-containing protein n=1 Tax=Paraliomyxa miuraensis TaxID=376150 RepID=UPI00225BE140
MSQTLNLSIYKNNQFLEAKTLAQDVIKIGKLKSSHLCLEDDTVARMHAVIEVSGSDIRVIDLGSSTGTILNDERVEKNAVLKSGDVLVFGPYRIEVEVVQGAVAAAPTAMPMQPQMQQPMAPMMAGAPMGAAAPQMMAQQAYAQPHMQPHMQPGYVPLAQRPPMQIDASEVERQDGTQVAEVISSYNDTVLDVQHVGQVKSKKSQAPLFLGIGGILMLVGLGIVGNEVLQDWDGYHEEQVKAQELGRPAPQAPGLGIAGIGIGLALLGLVPFGFGVVRLDDTGVGNYTVGESPTAVFHAPVQGLPDAAAFPLVRGNGSDYTLNFTQGMTGDVTLEGQTLSLADLVSSGRAGAMGSVYSFPMPAGAHVRLQHNGVTYHVNTVPPGKVIAAKSEADKPFWIYNA